MNLSTDAPLLILKYSVAAVELPANVTLLENVAAPVTPNVELRVAAPVTPNVELRVAAPVTPRVVLADKDVNEPAAAVTPAKVDAPVTPRVPKTAVLPVSAATVNFPELTLTEPVIARFALRIVVVPVVAPIVTAVPAPAKFTVVAVVLTRLNVVAVEERVPPFAETVPVADNVVNAPVDAVPAPIVVLFIEPEVAPLTVMLSTVVEPVKIALAFGALVNTSASIPKKLLSSSSFVNGEPLNIVLTFVAGVELLR